MIAAGDCTYLGYIGVICGLEVGLVDKRTSPAAELERFLNMIDECMQEYRCAYDAVKEEEYLGGERTYKPRVEKR